MYAVHTCQVTLSPYNYLMCKLKKIYEIYGDDYVVYSKDTEEEKVELRLPIEFKSLLKVQKVNEAGLVFI